MAATTQNKSRVNVLINLPLRLYIGGVQRSVDLRLKLLTTSDCQS